MDCVNSWFEILNKLYKCLEHYIGYIPSDFSLVLHVACAVIIDKLARQIIPEKTADSASENDEETEWLRCGICAVIYILSIYYKIVW